jgi:hypothetical protein
VLLNGLESFVHGFHGAMYVGGAITLAAAALAFFGLAGVRAPARAPEGAESAAPVTPIEV